MRTALRNLQTLSGARLAAGEWTANVIKKGVVPLDGPQFGVIIPFARVRRVDVFKDGATLREQPLFEPRIRR
jgi:hypothetical protein